MDSLALHCVNSSVASATHNTTHTGGNKHYAQYNQGLIEPLKAARGHATSNADSVDREM